jgi:ComF family protein
MRRPTSSCNQADGWTNKLCHRWAAVGSIVGGSWVSKLKLQKNSVHAGWVLLAWVEEYIDPMNVGARFGRLIERARLALPSQCAVCRSWPAERVCTQCVNRFAQPAHRCRRCALRLAMGTQECANCLSTPSPLDACFAAVPYEYPWANLITDYKFQPDPAWAPSLAKLMQSMPHMEAALEQADWVVPIPLTPLRLAGRGFNQALLLAKMLAPTKILPRTLLRVTQSAAQSTQNRTDRLQSMRNAFVLDPFLQTSIEGRRVVVIDDVMTTGATLYAAAQVLRDAGAIHLTGMVFARTEREQ